MRTILQELLQAVKAGREVVYCAVVATRGSTPQKAGAAMLIYPDGQQVGTLGGGCVEAEVKQQALRILTEGKTATAPQPAILSFTLDDDYGWDDGLICGGRMEMLVEPVQTEDLSYFQRYYELLEEGQGCLEAVVLDSSIAGLETQGARFLFNAQGKLVARYRAETPPNGTLEEVGSLEERRRPWTRRGVAFLPSWPRCRLVIVGAGHVGQAVAGLADQADFDIWVIDDRHAYANRERFPQAERIIVGELGPMLQKLEVTPNTYCLIVTRGHDHDEEALYHLVQKGTRYVGLIGSRRKIRLIYDDLIAQDIPADALEKVHAPVGFHIGSQTVPEIAISIVAELIAHRNLGYSPEHFRARTPQRAKT